MVTKRFGSFHKLIMDVFLINSMLGARSFEQREELFYYPNAMEIVLLDLVLNKVTISRYVYENLQYLLVQIPKHSETKNNSNKAEIQTQSSPRRALFKLVSAWIPFQHSS